MFGVFTPQEVENKSQQRAMKDAQRARHIAETTQELLKQQNDAEKEFDTSMRMMRQQYTEEQERFKLLIREKTKEVEKLEKRREEALRPPLLSEKEVKSKEEALWARELRLNASEEKNEETYRELTRKLNEVADQQKRLDEREHTIERRKIGIDLQADQIQKTAKQINDQMAKIVTLQSDWETKKAKEEAELESKRRNLKDAERLLEDRELEIAAAQRLIQDRRLQLDKGFEELRKLKEKDVSNPLR